MNAKFAVLLAITTLGAVACSNEPGPATGESPQAAAPAPSQPPAARETAAAAPAPASAATRTEPAQAAQAARSQEPSGRFQEGTHYQTLTPAQSTSSGADKIEVAEVFMYSCPACFSFEPFVEQWLSTKADDVSFVRIPAAWNPLARTHAQAFYTAEALGKLEEMNEAFFTEIHVNRNLLDNQSSLRTFFGRFGVDAQTFDSTFESFAVHTKLRRSDDLIRRYRVQATPTVVVNGKYVTSGTMAGSYETWFDIIDDLTAVERAATAN